MRKLHNKKGFSLVELMIVVVIMGILMAVAIPLYGAVTDNAEAKTCGTNQDEISLIFHKYVLIDERYTSSTIFNDGYTSFNSKTDEPEDAFSPEFMQFFKSGEFPHCPVEGNYYVIEAGDDEYVIEITCYSEDGTEMTKHTN